MNDGIRAKISGRIKRAADEGAIQDILKQIEIAWNCYCSVSIPALFAEDANFIQIFEEQLDGRIATEASHRYIFDTVYGGSHANFTLRSIHFVRPDVAIVFARAQAILNDGGETREMEGQAISSIEVSAEWPIAPAAC